MNNINCCLCKFCSFAYEKPCYLSALSESEQKHLEASMKENKALMQELAEK